MGFLDYILLNFHSSVIGYLAHQLAKKEKKRAVVASRDFRAIDICCHENDVLALLEFSGVY
jgi:hypothetical protein